MNKTIKIAEGNVFDLVVPLVLIQDTINPELITDLQVVVKVSNGDAVTASVTKDDNNAVITFAEELSLGSYDVTLTGKYDTRKFAILLNNAFAICKWSNGATYDYRITPEDVTLQPQPLVGWWATDAELNALKAAYRTAIADYNAATADLEDKTRQIEGVAQQGEDTTATNTKLLYEITHLVVPPPTGVAQQDTLTQGIADIRGDIAGIDIDTSTLAKESQVKDGNDTAISVAKEVRSEVGTGSDTAAETGTLFAVVKWVKDKVKSIYNALTDSTSGLGAIITAIGNISIDTTTIAKQGNNANANISDIQSLIGYTIQEIDGV